MSPRARRLLSLLVIACVAWVALAIFVQLDRTRGDRNLQMAVGAVGLVAYLLTIGYAIYYRAHWAKPRASAAGRRHLGPLARWMLTIVAVGGFGLAVGIGFPEATATYAGQLILMTGTLGGIAVGLVATMSSTLPVATEVESQRDAPAPPTFVRSASRLVGWWFGMVAASVLLFGPGYLVHRQFRQRVDIPACQAVCAAHDAAFESFFTTKSAYNCNCRGPAGRHTFHERAYLGGGHGFGAALLDFFARAAAIVGTTLAWLGLLFVAATRLSPPAGKWSSFLRRRRP